MAAFPDSFFGTCPTCHRPWHDTGTYDYFGGYNGTGTATATYSNHSCHYYPFVREPEAIEDPKVTKLRLARAASKRAMRRAELALRAGTVDPTTPVPWCGNRPHKPSQVRRVSKGRVCSSSSRYRVLMR